MHVSALAADGNLHAKHTSQSIQITSICGWFVIYENLNRAHCVYTEIGEQKGIVVARFGGQDPLNNPTIEQHYLQ
ncbi:hypothetical protein evm_011919 [Chilo suppressalis]|nr:hypothetical protein evm_011919 [Chilo suppressalis]